MVSDELLPAGIEAKRALSLRFHTEQQGLGADEVVEIMRVDGRAPAGVGRTRLPLYSACKQAIAPDISDEQESEYDDKRGAHNLERIAEYLPVSFRPEQREQRVTSEQKVYPEQNVFCPGSILESVPRQISEQYSTRQNGARDDVVPSDDKRLEHCRECDRRADSEDEFKRIVEGKSLVHVGRLVVVFFGMFGCQISLSLLAC